MTTLANAFRKAMGLPENNNITGDYIEKKKQEKLDKEYQQRLDKLDAEESRDRFGYGEYERINDRGFKELGFWDNSYGLSRWIPVCSQCGCCTIGNHGQGTMCENCITQDILDCSHDNGYFY